MPVEDEAEPGDHPSALGTRFRAPQQALVLLQRRSDADLVAASQSPAGDDVAGLIPVV